MPHRSITRRELLQAAAVAGAAGAIRGARAETGLPLGVATASYNTAIGQQAALREPLAFLKFCRERGAAGVQHGIPANADTAAIKRYLGESGMWLEGSVRVPLDAGDVERFEREVVIAKQCGAEVVRSVLTGARRYETFTTAGEVVEFRKKGLASLQLAAPVMARHKLRLAMENHKDLRAEEQVELLKAVSSEYVGATLDTGNSLALLEDPLETLAALGPWTFSVHLKDMAVDECPEGFLLAEIPLGQGFLPLQELVDGVRKHRAGVRFNLEMITRDPLVVPCLTERYWATMSAVPGRVLARTLSLVRKHAEGRPLPRTTGLGAAERLRLEDDNVRRCIDFARTRLKTA